MRHLLLSFPPFNPLLLQLKNKIKKYIIRNFFYAMRKMTREKKSLRMFKKSAKINGVIFLHNVRLI